mmetsp:Transcript_22040/g.50348  ORF Transcript_22040/g.50348 Transcript_22040/m.50348 type:complete len:205 (+) Transcript_22040:531-1145(+)
MARHEERFHTSCRFLWALLTPVEHSDVLQELIELNRIQRCSSISKETITRNGNVWYEHVTNILAAHLIVIPTSGTAMAASFQLLATGVSALRSLPTTAHLAHPFAHLPWVDTLTIHIMLSAHSTSSTACVEGSASARHTGCYSSTTAPHAHHDRHAVVGGRIAFACACSAAGSSTFSTTSTMATSVCSTTACASSSTTFLAICA